MRPPPNKNRLPLCNFKLHNRAMRDHRLMNFICWAYIIGCPVVLLWALIRFSYF
jgi:hypothetical protein